MIEAILAKCFHDWIEIVPAVQKDKVRMHHPPTNIYCEPQPIIYSVLIANYSAN